MEAIDFTTGTREKAHTWHGIVSVVMAFILALFKLTFERVYVVLTHTNVSFNTLYSTPIFAWLLFGLLLGFFGIIDNKNKRLFGILGFSLNILHLFSNVITIDVDNHLGIQAVLSIY